LIIRVNSWNNTAIESI